MGNPNEAVVRKWFREVWDQRSEAAVHELLNPDSVCHGEGGDLTGAGAFLDGFYRPFLAAFPDVKVSVEGLIADGDQVAVRWVATGTHTGAGMGFSATNKKISFRGVTWVRLRDGKLVEGWDCWNQNGLIQVLQGGSHPPSMTVV